MEALEKTERSKKTADKKAAKEAASGKLRGRKRTRRFWFEKYRWAILSGGHLFIGGKDAKGNDVLVRKHLSTSDLYFHADLHGAPSCSLKLKEGLVPSNTQEGLIPRESLPCRSPRHWERVWMTRANWTIQLFPRLLKWLFAGLEHGGAVGLQQLHSMLDPARFPKPRRLGFISEGFLCCEGREAGTKTSPRGSNRIGRSEWSPDADYRSPEYHL